MKTGKSFRRVLMNDDMPWVNLTQEEIEELRNKKQLSEYTREKIRAIGKECMLRYDEALRKLAE
jgi:PP-loop superfamily ATP-utilizing enzyme